MRRHISLYMLLAIAGGLLVAAALAGCAPDTSAPELQQNVAQLEEADTSAEADVLTTDEQNDTGDTDMGTGAVIAQVEFTDQACLDCHTDQARLQELAVEEEDEGESLSEGPG